MFFVPLILGWPLIQRYNKIYSTFQLASRHFSSFASSLSLSVSGGLFGRMACICCHVSLTSHVYPVSTLSHIASFVSISSGLLVHLQPLALTQLLNSS